MINNFKMGTKLIAGFTVVLLLAGIIAAAGIYAIFVSDAATDELYRVSQVMTDAQKAHVMLQDALIASERGVATRDSTFAKVAANECEKVLALLDSCRKRSQQADSQQRIDSIAELVKTFVKTDTEWYAMDAKKLEMRQGQVASADATLAALAAVRESIMTLGKEATQTEATQTTVPNYLTLVKDVDDCLIDFWRVRRMSAQYDGAMGDEKSVFDAGRRALSQDIAALILDIRKRFDALSTRMKTEKDGELIRQASKAIADYDEARQKYVAIDEQLNRQQEAVGKCSEMIVKQTHDFDETLEAIVQESLKVGKEASARCLYLIYFFSAVVVVLSLCVNVILTRNITTGVKTVVDVMTRIAKLGDLKINFVPSFLARRDEMGDLARGAEFIVKDYQQIDNLAGDLARGNWNLSVRVKGEQDTMNQRLALMLTDVNTVLREIDHSVAQVTTGASEIASAAQSLSNGAQSSAASLEQISASMNEIQGQTQANAARASTARDLTQKMTSAAATGQSAMREMNDSMGRITSNSQEVQRVIKVIDDIAFQTNLLALNAAVEAARAGQHGKGFAVVAEEVRNLAARSAKAAHETETLIANSGDEIRRGGDIATRTTGVLDAIVEQIKQTSDLVAGISVASDEQAQGVSQVSIGLQQIDGVIQQNTAAAEESASAANEMTGMARSLQELVKRFELRAT